MLTPRKSVESIALKPTCVAGLAGCVRMYMNQSGTWMRRVPREVSVSV